MMLGEPRIVVTEFVGAQDLAGHPVVHGAMRIGLGIGVGMGREQDAEFHGSLFPQTVAGGWRPDGSPRPIASHDPMAAPSAPWEMTAAVWRSCVLSRMNEMN